MKNQFVNIDGTIIKKDSITSITKIIIGGDNGSMFDPKEYYVFHVQYEGGSLRYTEWYEIYYWTRYSKSQIEKDDALRKITKKRNEILTILGIPV